MLHQLIEDVIFNVWRETGYCAKDIVYTKNTQQVKILQKDAKAVSQIISVAFGDLDEMLPINSPSTPDFSVQSHPHNYGKSARVLSLASPKRDSAKP